jgi:hypothetical protein
MPIQEPTEKHQKEEDKKEKYKQLEFEFDFDIAKEDNVAPI